MFNSLRDYLTEVEGTAESTSAFLRRLNGARTRLRNAIAKSEAEVAKYKNEKKFVADLKEDISKSARQLAKTILLNHFTTALRTNKEFDEPVYRLPMLVAIGDDDTYLVRTSGTGYKSKVSVDINLDKTAGRLNMWGAAIKAYRAELGVSVPRKDSKKYKKKALQASRAWAGIYNRRAGGGKWLETVEGRLELAAKPAPYWQLIDKGAVKMSSDRGGYPTPKNTNTNFVHKAEEEISAAILGLFDTAKEKYDSLFVEYNEFIAEAKDRMLRLDHLAEEIRLDLRIVRTLQKRLETEEKQIDDNKFQKAVQLIRQGMLNKGRIDVTPKGTKKRTTFSVNTIKDMLY